MYFTTALMLAVVVTDGMINGFTPLTLTGSIVTGIGLTYIALRKA